MSTTRIPSVTARCVRCSQQITVYDVRLYPAATPSRQEGEAVLYSIGGKSEFGVCVVYEYSELDPDQDFDQNDLSWCEVYVVDDDGIVLGRVISDETS